MAYGSKVAASPRLASRINHPLAGASSTLARSADVRRRSLIAQGSSGVMAHIAIELFLLNSLEFIVYGVRKQ